MQLVRLEILDRVDHLDLQVCLELRGSLVTQEPLVQPDLKDQLAGQAPQGRLVLRVQ